MLVNWWLWSWLSLIWVHVTIAELYWAHSALVQRWCSAAREELLAIMFGCSNEDPTFIYIWLAPAPDPWSGQCHASRWMQYQYRISTVSISVLFIFGKYFNTKGGSQLENLIETFFLCCCMIFSPILLVACSQLLWVFVCLFECWGDAHYNYYETLNIINGMYGHYIYLYLQHSTMFGKYGFDIIIKTNLLLECGYQKILII